MNDIFEAFLSRIRSPVFGYAFTGFLIVNWKPIFYVFFSNDSVLERFAFFDLNTTWLTIFIYPLSIGIALALLNPWVTFLFLWANQKAIYRRSTIEAKAESKVISLRKDLEDERNALYASRERKILERANIDQAVSEITDPKAKAEAEKQLSEIRAEQEAESKKLDVENSLGKKGNEVHRSLYAYVKELESELSVLQRQYHEKETEHRNLKFNGDHNGAGISGWELEGIEKIIEAKKSHLNRLKKS